MDNIVTSGDKRFAPLLDRLVYIAPVNAIYNLPPSEYYYFNKKPRSTDIISSFNGRTGSKRRHAFALLMMKTRFPVLNRGGGSDFIQLATDFRNSKLLLNIHQTPHHHTLEEFRVGMC